MKSEELQDCNGLSLLPGVIRKLKVPYKIPHMGWNELKKEGEIALWNGVEDGSFVYYVHSYYADCPNEIVYGISEYGVKSTWFCSKKEIYTVRSFILKSGDIGMQMLKNFRSGRKHGNLPSYRKRRRCVRLYQGEFSKETVMNEDPVAQAIIFETFGAKRLHIVDLDGAVAGESLNLSVIERICKAVRIPVQVGGGIRSLVSVEKLFSVE